MGMYDEIICKYKLPGKPPAFVTSAHVFQTKDLDEGMATYTISEDGVLSYPNFTGRIEFYTGNLRQSSNGFRFTDDGSDFESVQYSAHFKNSVLHHIAEDERTREPALPTSAYLHRPYEPPTPEQIAENRRREAESLMGRSLYLMWGGQMIGYPVIVLAEDDKAWCVRSDEHGMEIIQRCQRDHLLFDTKEAAIADRQASVERYESHRKHEEEYYTRLLAERRVEKSV